MRAEAFATASTGPETAGEPILDPLALLASPGPAGPAVSAILQGIPTEQIRSLLDRLVYHRVDGLAWRTLSCLPADGRNDWLRATLRRRHQTRAAATLAQGLALAEILEGLDRAGIPVVVQRGLRVVEWIYKDAGARPFEDHDLLILPRDAAGAAAVLTRLGYEAIGPALYRRTTVLVDLHIDPLGAARRPSRARVFPIDLAALFASARPGYVAGGPALLLRSEDDLVLMALHVVKHSFDLLVRTADLAHLLAVEGRALSWERVRETAERARAFRLVALALGALLPFGVEPPAPFRLDEPVGGLTGLLLQRVRALRPLPYGGEVLMALQAPRFADRVRFLFDALLPAGESGPGLDRIAAAPRRGVVVLEEAVRERRARRQAR
ncbi:MAG TPA: nucleotidyltransferase family protein [Candidatus Polarisedimenticolia bacterium]|nr:nucleotidyltransferase family protein [Candidatus Polarisedimenticolia bacterium]